MLPTRRERPSTYVETPPTYGEMPSTYGARPSTYGARPPTYGEMSRDGARPSTYDGRPSTYDGRPSTYGERPSTKYGKVKEARAPSKGITLDDLIGLQTSSGSFAMTETEFRLRFMRHFSHKVISEMDQCIERTNMLRAEFQAIRDTVLIAAFIKFHYPESAELWELVVLKARDWVGRHLRDPDVLTELEKIARDNIGSASSAMPTTGSSDVSTTPLKRARSTDNTDIVAEKAGEDNLKEHAVGHGAETDTES
jgi:hypothetical protein